MKTKPVLLSAVSLIALIAFFTLPSWSHSGMKGMHMGHETHAAKNKTITGEIVDLACYLGHGARGKKHGETCGKACLANGSPMGLLTKKNSLFLLVDNHDHEEVYSSAKKMAGELVEVTGNLKREGGLKALIVEKVKLSSTKK